MVEYCVAAFAEHCEQRAFRSYVGDGLKVISETLAEYYGGGYLENRFADLIDIKREPEKTGDEVALDVITRAGLKVE